MLNTVIPVLLALVIAGISLPLISLLVEAMRPGPATPKQLRWAPNIPIQYIDVNGSRLRYIKAGEGPALVLLHTLRTQLDLFEKVVPGLTRRYTVYALDYPGHGYSYIPAAKYDAAFFTEAVEGFLETLDLRDVTLAGVSIGGSISLILAARNNPRVSRVVAINPYDYAKGRGILRSSLLARFVIGLSGIPIVGETVMRLRTFFVMKAVLEGGVSNPRHIPPELLKEMYLTGNRSGHYRAFINLLRNAQTWETAAKAYSKINIPVLLLWGDQDWSRPEERERDRQIVPGVRMVTVKDGGHFLPLDRPNAVTEHLLAFQAYTVTNGVKAAAAS